MFVAFKRSCACRKIRLDAHIGKRSGRRLPFWVSYALLEKTWKPEELQELVRKTTHFYDMITRSTYLDDIRRHTGPVSLIVEALTPSGRCGCPMVTAVITGRAGLQVIPLFLADFLKHLLIRDWRLLVPSCPNSFQVGLPAPLSILNQSLLLLKKTFLSF